MTYGQTYIRFSFTNYNLIIYLNRIFVIQWSNHSNILMFCSRNISDYYQCWKQSCCTIFLLHFIFHDSLMNRKFKRTAFICTIINVTFDQFNAFLLNKCVHFYINKVSLIIRHTWWGYETVLHMIQVLYLNTWSVVVRQAGDESSEEEEGEVDSEVEFPRRQRWVRFMIHN